MTPAGPRPDDPLAPLRARAQAAQRRRQRRRKRPAAAGASPAAPRTPAAVPPARRAGNRAEARAWRHLVDAGLTPVARNVACRRGEVDLVMRDGPVLVFVEVRARAPSRFGKAGDSIDLAKQRRIAMAAQHFLSTRWRGPPPPCRFDAVLLDGDHLQWIRAAFDARA